MKRKSVCAAMFAATVFELVSPAAAVDRESFEMRLSPGNETLIHDRAYYDDNCVFTAYPEFVVLKKPKQGKTVVRKVKFVIPEGNCKGKIGQGLALRYQANPGARGDDTFSFQRVFKQKVEYEGTVKIVFK